jgi:hypothetical protein
MMAQDCPIQRLDDGTTLRLEWDNSRVRKDIFTGCLSVFFWSVWAPATVVATYGIFAEPSELRWFFAFWCIFGWAGTLAIPYSLLGRTWSEWVEISEHTLSHGHAGFLAPRPKSFPLSTILCIFYGHCEEVSVVTLSIFRLPGRLGLQNRHMVGYWLAPDLKKHVFDMIQEFVREKQLPVELRKGYTP